MKKITEYGLDSIVRFFPPVKRDQVTDWYSMADLMVLQSKVEGISMSLIEAAAAGLPVLVSNRVANCYEIAKDKAGIVVDPNDGAVASALRTILSAPSLLNDMSVHARKSAEIRYDIERVGWLMMSAYENILKSIRSEALRWM